jgi:hypothetical protein
VKPVISDIRRADDHDSVAHARATQCLRRGDAHPFTDLISPNKQYRTFYRYSGFNGVRHRDAKAGWYFGGVPNGAVRAVDGPYEAEQEAINAAEAWLLNERA